MKTSGMYRWIGKDCGDLRAGICFRCGKALKPGKAVVMEEDVRYSTYHDLGVPEDHIDTIMVVGLDCAKTLRRLTLEEESPVTSISLYERLDRMTVFNEKLRQQWLASEPDPKDLRKERLDYCDYVDQVIADQRQKAESKKSRPAKN